MKIPKKRNKIKGCSITYSHIWYVDISKCVYCLDTHSVNVWSSYVLPNTNAVLFYDIFFLHSALLPTCLQEPSQKSTFRLHWNNFEKNTIFLVNKPLYIKYCRLQAQYNDRQSNISYFCLNNHAYILSI